MSDVDDGYGGGGYRLDGDGRLYRVGVSPEMLDPPPLNLTLRQHYAGLAMTRLAADFGPVPAATIAKRSWELADALIAAEKESKS